MRGDQPVHYVQRVLGWLPDEAVHVRGRVFPAAMESGLRLGSLVHEAPIYRALRRRAATTTSIWP